MAVKNGLRGTRFFYQICRAIISGTFAMFLHTCLQPSPSSANPVLRNVSAISVFPTKQSMSCSGGIDLRSLMLPVCFLGPWQVQLHPTQCLLCPLSHHALGSCGQVWAPSGHLLLQLTSPSSPEQLTSWVRGWKPRGCSGWRAKMLWSRSWKLFLPFLTCC